MSSEHTPMQLDDIAVAERLVRDRVTSSLEGLVHDTENLLRTAQKNGSDEFNAARDKIERQLLHARYELQKLDQHTAQRLHRAYRVTTRAVREHPYSATGLVVGACVLIGLLSWRASRGSSSC